MNKIEIIKRIVSKLEVVQENNKEDLLYLEGRIDQLLADKKKYASK